MPIYLGLSYPNLFYLRKITRATVPDVFKYILNLSLLAIHLNLAVNLPEGIQLRIKFPIINKTSCKDHVFDYIILYLNLCLQLSFYTLFVFNQFLFAVCLNCLFRIYVSSNRREFVSSNVSTAWLSFAFSSLSQHIDPSILLHLSRLFSDCLTLLWLL